MSDNTIRPFRIAIQDSQLADLRQRLSQTRWPEPLPGEPWARGVPVDYLRRLASYWTDSFDWRTQESRLNRFPQFQTELDGQTIHFLHVASPRADATPLLLIHGWPGSFIEFLDLVEPLTQPQADSEPAFHLVIPSIPGFGFSTPLSGEGWNNMRIGKAFAGLMARLGYERYGIQGGDAGAEIAPAMGYLDADRIIGIHVNAAAMGFIPFPPLPDEEKASLSPREQQRLAGLERFVGEQQGYAAIQSTRPQTLSLALTDSPVGQLAWIVEKFKEWTDPQRELPEDAVDRDALLTDVSLYWFTGTAGSAANWYRENAVMRMQQQAKGGEPPKPSGVPTGVANFTQDVAIRRYAERGNTIVHWSEFERGGHFAALEAPDLLVGDIRVFFAALAG